MVQLNARKWLKIVLSSGLLIAIFIGGFNYIVDPYGLNNIFKVAGFNKYKESNTGYAFRFKTNEFKKQKFDNLLIGTSRVGVMNPEVVNSMLGGKTFNFASSGSITEIQKELFEYALKNSNIKNVIYGVDFLSLNGAITLEKKFKEFCEIEEKLKENDNIYNFDLYFNYTTFVDSIKLILRNRSEKIFFEKKYQTNGMRDYIDYIEEVKDKAFNIDKKIEQSIISYYHHDVYGGYQNYKISDNYFEYIQEIVTICKENQINLWVYIPPMYKDHFDALAAYGIYGQFEEFKRKLLSITNYVDFTGHNSVTDTKSYFWDGSHLRKEYTPLIMGRVLERKEIQVPNDFGIYVTKENIEAHLQKLKEGIRPYDINSLIEEEL